MVEARGEMSVVEAGRKGGRIVSSRYGREFYSRIGKKGAAVLRGMLGESYNDRLKEIGITGGQASKEKYGPDFYKEIGRKGGESLKRKVAGTNHYSDISKRRGRQRL